MIKAEDLRIGDFVRVSHKCSIPEGTGCVVTEIYPERQHILWVLGKDANLTI